MSCAEEHACPATLVNLGSALEPREAECVVDSTSSSPTHHVVEVWNLGTNRYRAKVLANCEAPLEYPNSSQKSNWQEPLIIEPKMKRADSTRFQYTINADPNGSGDGLQTPKVHTRVSLEARLDRGREMPFINDIPSDGLSFECRFR